MEILPSSHPPNLNRGEVSEEGLPRLRSFLSPTAPQGPIN